MRLSTLIATSALAAACGRNPPEPATAGSGSSDATGSGSAAPLPITHPRAINLDTGPRRVHLDEPTIILPKQLAFVLVDPGKGARAPLRYELAGPTVDYGVETRLKSRHLENGEWTPVVAQPAQRDGFAITPGTKPGLLAIRALPAELVGTKSPEAEQYAARWTKLLANRRMTATLDPRGELASLEFADDPAHTRGPEARDEAQQRLLGVVVPLPEAPVGVGASWRVTTALKQNLAVVEQTATYTLTARTATSWTVHVKIRRDAEQQIIDDPGLPVGARAEVVAIFRVLEGDLTLSPAQPIGAGTLTIESRVHARITPQDEAQLEQMLEDTGEIVLTATPEPAAGTNP